MHSSTAERDRLNVLHPFTALGSHQPLVFDRGEGVWIYDEEGNRYLEGLAGLWSASLGYSEPRLAEAAYRQLNRLPFMHMFTSVSHAPGAELAEALKAIAPVPVARVFFANSGSEAIDSAVKMIWYFNNALGRPQKKKIIARHDAYHGSLIAGSSLTGLPNNHKLFDLPLPQILHTAKPHYYHGGNPGESEREYSRRLAAELDQLIEREGPDTVAAFFAEPVMGVGGVIVPPEGYWDEVQAVLAKHDVLLVADEVICGFGRTGNMWGSQTVGMRPDMIVAAKALSASYLPISAVLVSDRVYGALEQGSDQVGLFAHGFTYSGHPVCAAVALECLAIYEERDIVEHVRRVGPRLQDGLRARFAGHPMVGEVRGVGLMAGVELMADKSSRTKFDPRMGVGNALRTAAIEQGVLLRAMGDTLGFSPPLIISEEEIDFVLASFGAALDQTWERFGSA